MNPKILVIRFSSFGDIAQALTASQRLKDEWPSAHIEWLVREDFSEFLQLAGSVDRIVPFARRSGTLGLWRLAGKLAKNRYTHVYDAHNNLRSHILVWFLRGHVSFWSKVNFVRRPKHRLRRWLHFNLRLKAFSSPTLGALTYVWPLRAWGVAPRLPTQNLYRVKPSTHRERIGLLPSAAWPLKRWPVEYFKQLILALPQTQFTIFGGPEDTFTNEIETLAPDRIENLSGKVSLVESCHKLTTMKALVGSDTGLMHVADGLGIPLVMLVGPSAFGYPYNVSSQVAEIDLECKPCSKDGRDACKNPTWQKCLQDLEPQVVLAKLRNFLS